MDTILDVLEIANLLEKLYLDKELRDSLGKAAQDFTLANFGVECLVKDHEKLYKRLIANQTKF